MSDKPDGLTGPRNGVIKLIRVEYDYPLPEVVNANRPTPVVSVPELDVELDVTAQGTVFAVPADRSEVPRVVFAAEDLRFDDVDDATSATKGDVVLPYDDGGKKYRFLRYSGTGTLTFTDRQLLGLFWSFNILDHWPEMSAGVDHANGTFVVWVAAIPRDALPRIVFMQHRKRTKQLLFHGERATVECTPHGIVDIFTGDIEPKRYDAYEAVADAFIDGNPIVVPPKTARQAKAGFGGIAGLGPSAPTPAASDTESEADAGTSDAPSDTSDTKRGWVKWAVAATVAVGALTGVGLYLAGGEDGKNAEDAHAVLSARAEAIGTFRREMREALETGGSLTELSQAAEQYSLSIRRVWDTSGISGDSSSAGGRNTLPYLRKIDEQYTGGMSSLMGGLSDGSVDHQLFSRLDGALARACMSELGIREETPELVPSNIPIAISCDVDFHADVRSALGAPTGLGYGEHHQVLMDEYLSPGSITYSGEFLSAADLAGRIDGTGHPDAPLAAYVAAIEAYNQGDCAAALVPAANAAGQFVTPDKALPGDFDYGPMDLLNRVTDPACPSGWQPPAEP